MKFKTKYINPKKLKETIDKKEKFVLIDVLPEEFYKEEHIDKSLNFDVYAMDFIIEIKKKVKDKKEKIILYDSSNKSIAAEFGAEKLKNEGYKNVHVLDGGMQGWKFNKYKTIKSKIIKPKIKDIKFSIDKEKSFIMWTGRSLTGRHYGLFDKWTANFEIKGDNLQKGIVEIDVKSLRDIDLKGSGYRNVLETHLLSDDFFDVKNFPKADFKLTSATKIKGINLGNPNYNIKGKLTIKQITKPIEVEAMMGYTSDGKFVLRGHFDFDRTQHNVIYGSLKFFEKLGMHLVSDHITVEFFFIGR